MHSMPDTQSVLFPSYTVGPEAYRELAAAIAPYGKRILLIGGEKAMQAGLDRFSAALGDRAEITGIRRFSGECTVSKAQELAQQARECSAEIIAGMGGGKAIDTAKACGHFAGLPVITLPTIAATCAAVTKLSVMYHEDGAFDRFLFLDTPPVRAFIHTGIIAAAPSAYLRAGMGDAIAKHFESDFSAREDTLSYTDSLGLAIGRTCWEPLVEAGGQALADCESGLDTPSLQTAVQCVILSTGLVSLLVKECYNGALAHSLYYAMETVPEIGRCLHGDVVAFGVLVQLMMDGKRDTAYAVRGHLKRLKAPVTFAEMGLRFPFPGLPAILEETLRQPDMAHLPYPVTPQMIKDAMAAVEALGNEQP